MGGDEDEGEMVVEGAGGRLILKKKMMLTREKDRKNQQTNRRISPVFNQKMGKIRRKPPGERIKFLCLR